MYQNGYLHGSPSKLSAKSAIYTADRCQHIIAIHTIAVAEQIQTIYTAAVCPHRIAISTAAIQEPIRLYTLLPGVCKKSLFTRQPFKSQIGYIHCCRVYTKKNCYLHGSRSRAKSVIYIAAGCIHRLLFTRQPFKSQLGYLHCCRVYIHEIVIYTAAVQEPNQLCDYCSADRGLCFHICKKLILS